MLLSEIAKRLDARLVGNGDVEIVKVANLKTATGNEISFLSDSRYKDVLSESAAGAVIVREADVEHVKGAALVMGDPYVGFARVAQLLDTTPQIATAFIPPPSCIPPPPSARTWP